MKPSTKMFLAATAAVLTCGALAVATGPETGAAQRGAPSLRGSEVREVPTLPLARTQSHRVRESERGLKRERWQKREREKRHQEKTSLTVFWPSLILIEY